MSKEVNIPMVDTVVKANNGWSVGAWLFENGWYYGECSRCGEMNYNQPSKYCPECGAMMVNYEPSLGYYREQLKKIPTKETEEQKDD